MAHSNRVTEEGLMNGLFIEVWARTGPLVGDGEVPSRWQQWGAVITRGLEGEGRVQGLEPRENSSVDGDVWKGLKR